MANPSTVSGALAPWLSAIPAPTTGTDSPTKSAMSRSDVMASRSSGALVFEHDPGGPLEHRTGTSADQRTTDQEEREVRDRKTHGDDEKYETHEHGETCR